MPVYETPETQLLRQLGVAPAAYNNKMKDGGRSYKWPWKGTAIKAARLIAEHIGRGDLPEVEYYRLVETPYSDNRLWLKVKAK